MVRWRHAEPASRFTSAFGADEVTRRVFAVKEGIVVEHKRGGAREGGEGGGEVERSSKSRLALQPRAQKSGDALEEEYEDGAGTGRAETPRIGGGSHGETLGRRAKPRRKTRRRRARGRAGRAATRERGREHRRTGEKVLLRKFRLQSPRITHLRAALGSETARRGDGVPSVMTSATAMWTPGFRPVRGLQGIPAGAARHRG